MYCSRCGTQIDEGKFCPKCGAVLSEPAEPKSLVSTANADASENIDLATPPPKNESYGHGINIPQYGADVAAAENPAPLQKFGKRQILILVGITLAAIIIIAVAVTGATTAKYSDLAKATLPFADEGMMYTSEEVFNAFLTSPSWDVETNNDGAWVNISGTAKNTSTPMTFRLRIYDDPNSESGYSYNFTRAGSRSNYLDDSDQAWESTEKVFLAYDAGYEDIANYVGVFAKSPADWTHANWNMATYNQQAQAAAAVLYDAAGSLYSGLPDLMSLADDNTQQQAAAQMVDTIDSTFNTVSSSTTLGDLSSALQTGMGFLGDLFEYGLQSAF